MGQDQLMPVNGSGFLQLKESCMERVGWKMPVMHLQSLNQQSWEQSGICLVKQVKTHPPLCPGDGRSGATLSLLLILVLGLCWDQQQTGVNVSGKPLLSCSPLEKGFTAEVAKLVLANAKTPAKGFQPLLASWVHEKVKNYAPHVQIPNSMTPCFTEQDAKQLASMTECKERKTPRQKRFSWERSSEGNFITRS